MRRALKWIGIVLGGLIGLLVLVVIGVLIYSQATYKRTVNRPVYEIMADTSSEGVERGEYLVRTVSGCARCHSSDGADGPLIGYVESFEEDLFSGVFVTPNLTPDKETGLGNWTDAEIARAIREGLDKDGVELLDTMPSWVYRSLSDAGVAAMVGYLRSLEPVRNDLPPMELSVLTKSVYTLAPIWPRNPTAPITAPQTAPSSGTARYGGYLATIAGCALCHGKDLAGGQGPQGPPAPDLTPGGDLGNWSEADFIATVRTRARAAPGGRLEGSEMPWKQYDRMTDEDLSAILKYLQSLPVN